MALKEDVASFLRNDYAVSQINFKLRSMDISSNMYKVIAYHLDVGRLKIKTAEQEKGVGATYFGKGVNTIFVPPHFNIANNIRNQMKVVHECTHAIIDYKAIGKHDFAENEACGYVAGALFAVYKDLAAIVPAQSFGLTMPGAIAQKVVLDGQHQINESDAIDLMIEIRTLSVYRKSKDYNSDGY